MIEQLVREHGKMNVERRHELRIAFKETALCAGVFCADSAVKTIGEVSEVV